MDTGKYKYKAGTPTKINLRMGNRASVWLWVGTLLVMLTSCSKKEETIFKGPYYVRFTEETGSAKESFSKPIKISVHHVGPQLAEPITITYAISGTAREGVDYRIVGGERGKVVIPANQSFGYITIQLINNANNILESQNLTLTLTDVTPGTLQVGTSKNGIIGKSTTFTILDDCILSGTYLASRGSGAPPIENITITNNDNECREYTLSNWDIYVFQSPRRRSLRFIDNGDNTLTIPSQEDPTLPDSLATIQGTGSVNPLTRRITFNVELPKFENSPVFQLTYIPD
jgi:hypothetical protein